MAQLPASFVSLLSGSTSNQGGALGSSERPFKARVSRPGQMLTFPAEDFTENIAGTNEVSGD
ncbi:MAG: hypothetical protein EPN30_05990 [Actinomycetota bacterium]|nr:MAG: hypothetical protein EPN30_05990 [Actinomycetota bacterium]